MLKLNVLIYINCVLDVLLFDLNLVAYCTPMYKVYLKHSNCLVHYNAYIEAMISAEFTQEPSIILLELLHTKTNRYVTLNSIFKVIPYSATLLREKTFTNWWKI